MALKTSLLITGDASTAQKAVEGLTRDVEALGVAGKGAAGGVAVLDRAQDDVAASSRAMAAAEGEAARALATMGSAASGAAGAVDKATRSSRQHTQAVNDNEAAARRNAFGMRNLGQQFGDFAVQVQGGIDPVRAFGTQAGQMGYALSEMGGKAGAVGAFLTGPWGVALTIAVTTLAPFVAKMFETSTAADKQVDALARVTNALAAYQRANGQAAQSETIKINLLANYSRELANNEIALRRNTKAALEAVKAQLAKDEADTTSPDPNRQFRIQQGQRALPRIEAAIVVADQRVGEAERVARVQAGRKVLLDVTAATDKAAAATQRYEVAQFSLERRFDKGLIPIEEFRKKSEQLVRTLNADKKAATGSSGAVGSAATDAGQQARLAAAQTATARAEAQLAITRRAGAAELKAGTITQAEYTAKLTAGEQAVNRAREADKGARTEKTAHTKATRDAAAAQRELDAAYTSILRKLDPIGSATRTYGEELAKIAQQRNAGAIDVGQDVILTLEAQRQRAASDAGVWKAAFETVNPGETFRTDVVRAAVESADVLRNGGAATGDAIKRGAIDAAGTLAGAVGSFGSTLSEFFPDAGSGAVGRAAQAGGQLFQLTKSFADGSQKMGQLTSSIQTIAQKGFGISEAGAVKIGEYGGKAIRGAAEGALVNSVFSPIAKGLGIKTSQTGAQLGGAIGSFIPIPGGQIVGAIAGSVLGGLLKSTPQGKVTLTSATGDVSATGNNGAAKAAAVGAAKSVQEGLQSIAEQLGGSLGAFNVTVGQRHGDYRVTTGSSLKVKSGAKDFDDDQAGAVGYAVQLAISQGAVTGLSAAIQKAIKSSSDVNTALKEALKVQNVELLVKGLSGQYEKAFTDLEATAKDRVRIAREYGLDVVAIEKRNAEDRVKLVDQLTKAQAGSLQALVTELTSGSLFEGSALDKLDAINGRITKAKADLDAGVDGASDTLADLYQQRLATSKDAYGATSAYADTRNSTIAEAQAAIARVNAQITAAQKSDPALKETNAALDSANATLDEMSGQNAQVLSALERNNALLEKLTSGGASGNFFDLERLAAV